MKGTKVTRNKKRLNVSRVWLLLAIIPSFSLREDTYGSLQLFILFDRYSTHSGEANSHQTKIKYENVFKIL